MNASGGGLPIDYDRRANPWRQAPKPKRAQVVTRAEYWLEQVAMRPKVSFDSENIWRRLEMCKEVARAYGWKSSEISSFSEEVNDAFSYEEAMAIIKRDFDVSEEPEDRLLGS